jgi:hypothetical protein
LFLKQEVVDKTYEVSFDFNMRKTKIDFLEEGKRYKIMVLTPEYIDEVFGCYKDTSYSINEAQDVNSGTVRLLGEYYQRRVL